MSLQILTPAAPVRQLIVERLRTAIIECHFNPGGRLVERELCEQMGVSRSSVREALRQLEAEGLITLIPHTGPQVAHLDSESMRQIYEMRAVLEGLAARLFVKNASNKDVASLVRTFDKMRAYVKSKNWTGMRKAQSRFYEVLAKGGKNDALSHQLMLLRARVALLRGMLPEERIAESLKEVATVIQHIKERDAKKAERACIVHIENSALAARELISKQENSEKSAEAAS